jgi:hypothetical protein
MSLHLDDTNIIDLHYLVFAQPLPTCDECTEEPAAAAPWKIAVILHVANQAFPTTLDYPTRGLRDAAFEAIIERLKRQRTMEEEEEDEEERYDAD